jgi:hypothetical protein
VGCFSLPTAVHPHLWKGDFPYSVRIDDPPLAPLLKGGSNFQAPFLRGVGGISTP